MPVDREITILIPAKDEEHRLPPFLEQVMAYCQAQFKNAQIIVINDGSTDRTSDVVRRLATRYPGLQLLELPFNRGKGYALKRGMFASQGEIVVFLDADGSTPIVEIGRHLHHFKNGVDIVIGSRVLTEPGIKIDARAHRKWIGTFFNAFVHFFLLREFKDTQCGFKMFRRSIVNNLFGRIYLNGFGVDMEILYVAKQLGLKIKEVAVNWHHVDGSKVNLITDSLRMMNNIFQIRSWHPIKLSYEHPHMSAQEIKVMAQAESSHWWFRAKSLFLQQTLAGLPAPKRILDAGCGSGENALVLKDKGFYVGIDAVKEALLYCQQRGLARLMLSNIKELPLKDAAFDLIVCLDVLEHVDDDTRALSELKRLLTKDGTLLIGVPSFRSLFSAHDVALSHLRRYNKRDLKNLLGDGGMGVEKLEYWFAASFLPVYLMRKIRNLFPTKNKASSDTSVTPHAAVNKLMSFILECEARLHHYLPMPFGTTLFAVVKKSYTEKKGPQGMRPN